MSDFPVGPVVKTLPSNAEDADSIPGQGAHTSDTPHRQKKTKHKAKRYCSKFNKDVENAPHQKNLRKKGGKKTMYRMQINIYNTHTYTKLLQLWLEKMGGSFE